ncbi:WhiB family transcriptional regulator [Rhodococcus sp. NPDC003318]|uniref:WhiB family transcriptional regulator n=1 Tax=Rhodococcus sp. NPDC003318 TaxID=3364503 RepID=UPI0036844954
MAMARLAPVSALPAATAEDWEWQLRARCRGMDSAMFFHPEGSRGSARTWRIRTAKAVCAECPVIEACREHALSVPEQYGIWGGLSESERDARRERRLPG